MWVPDLFMERVKSNGSWSLMCPHECPGLADTWGEDFKELYERYEKEGRARATVNAQQLWFAILQSQTETGTPYMLYKDACNRKSNQKVGIQVQRWLAHRGSSVSSIEVYLYRLMFPSLHTQMYTTNKPLIFLVSFQELHHCLKLANIMHTIIIIELALRNI